MYVRGCGFAVLVGVASGEKVNRERNIVWERDKNIGEEGERN